MVMSDASLTLRRTIRASRARLFRLWTEPAELVKWFNAPEHGLASAELDLRVGGTYRLGMRKLPDGEPFYVRGEYREIDPPKRIAFTWTWDSPGDAQNTLVTVDLIEVPGGTEVRITHELFANQKQVESHTAGWSAILESLAEYSEGE